METNFKNFTIKSKYLGDKKAPWSDDNKKHRLPENWNNHMVSVKNNETGEKIAFEFWNSIKNGEVKTHNELIGAFECLFMDATTDDFEDWCSNCGYDTDSRKALSIYRKCQKQTTKLEKLLGYSINENWETFSTLQEELQEAYN